MANTCFTSYAVTGPEAGLKRLMRDLKDRSGVPPEGPPPEWVGHFLRRTGHDPEKELDRFGEIVGYTVRLGEDGILWFDIESGWSRCECLEEILRKEYGVEVWFLEEELGCDVFCTNDAARRFFPQFIAIDDMDGEGLDYYDEADARAKLRELFGDSSGIDYDNDSLEELADAVFRQEEREVSMHIAQTDI